MVACIRHYGCSRPHPMVRQHGLGHGREQPLGTTGDAPLRRSCVRARGLIRYGASPMDPPPPQPLPIPVLSSCSTATIRARSEGYSNQRNPPRTSGAAHAGASLKQMAFGSLSCAACLETSPDKDRNVQWLWCAWEGDGARKS
jgi:hypothetical protein